MPTPAEPRRWLMPGGRTPAERRPLLGRGYSAPAVIERAANEVRDAYESLPFGRPKPVPIYRRLGAASREYVRAQEERAEAGAWRLAMRAAWWWLTRCWRRR